MWTMTASIVAESSRADVLMFVTAVWPKTLLIAQQPPGGLSMKPSFSFCQCTNCSCECALLLLSSCFPQSASVRPLFLFVTPVCLCCRRVRGGVKAADAVWTTETPAQTQRTLPVSTVWISTCYSHTVRVYRPEPPTQLQFSVNPDYCWAQSGPKRWVNGPCYSHFSAVPPWMYEGYSVNFYGSCSVGHTAKKFSIFQA